MLKTLEENIIFKNKYLTLYNNKVKSNDINETIVFDHLKIVEGDEEQSGSVVIIKYKNKYLLIESYRYPIDKKIFEFPRGYKNKNENFEENAIREAQEEIKLDIDNIKKISNLGTFYINPSILTSEVGVILVELNSEQELELQKKELIVNYKWVSFEELLSLTDALSISAFQLMQKHNLKQDKIKQEILHILRNIDISWNEIITKKYLKNKQINTKKKEIISKLLEDL